MGGGIWGPQFGDGSNKWIPGVVETVQNPIDRITNPGDTLAGAADAAALNFDEGVGGLASLFDTEPGNTAGPGQSGAGWNYDPQPGQPENPNTVDIEATWNDWTPDAPTGNWVRDIVVGLILFATVLVGVNAFAGELAEG